MMPLFLSLKGVCHSPAVALTTVRRPRGAAATSSRPSSTLLAISLTATLAGCAEKRLPLLTPPEPAIVWPAPPDEPRVRFAGQIVGSTDVHPTPTFGQAMDDLLHGPPPTSMLQTPYAVAVHADGVRFAIADTSAACVHVFNIAAQTYLRYEGAGSPPRRFESPIAVAYVGDALWVADSRVHGIARIAGGESTRGGEPAPWSGSASEGSSKKIPGRLGERWIGLDQLKRPSGLAWCEKNRLVYVADSGGHAVLAFEESGSLSVQFGSQGTGPGQFNCPAQMVCQNDAIWVIDALNSRVQRLALDGTPISMFGRKGDAAGDLVLPKGLAISRDGNLWIVDAQFENVQAFTPDGKLLMALGEEGHGPGQFWLPAGACVDGRNRLWIADSYNRRVQVFQLLQ